MPFSFFSQKTWGCNSEVWHYHVEIFYSFQNPAISLPHTTTIMLVAKKWNKREWDFLSVYKMLWHEISRIMLAERFMRVKKLWGQEKKFLRLEKERGTAPWRSTLYTNTTLQRLYNTRKLHLFFCVLGTKLHKIAYTKQVQLYKVNKKSLVPNLQLFFKAKQKRL